MAFFLSNYVARRLRLISYNPFTYRHLRVAAGNNSPFRNSWLTELYAVFRSPNSSNRSMACLPSATVRDSRINVSRWSIRYRSASALAVSQRHCWRSSSALFQAFAARSSRANSSCCKDRSEESIKRSGVGNDGRFMAGQGPFWDVPLYTKY